MVKIITKSSRVISPSANVASLQLEALSSDVSKALPLYKKTDLSADDKSFMTKANPLSKETIIAKIPP
jgi:hypothetical protein